MAKQTADPGPKDQRQSQHSLPTREARGEQHENRLQEDYLSLLAIHVQIY